MSDHSHSSLISWSVFDTQWYLKRYHDNLLPEEKEASQTQLEAIWKEKTVYLGRAPNRYFDEEWYLIANKNLQKTIKKGAVFQNGFQHYCELGYRHATPHWLFSENSYFKKNQDISFRKITRQGYKNGYDHFIQQGDIERRQIGLFFDHELFIHSCLQENVPFSFEKGAFQQYLSLNDKKYAHLRTSWYFDPKWYLSTYPEVKAMIEDGQYISALHHYFCNKTPTKYNPNAYFQEEYYINTYYDVMTNIENGEYRNAYEHFLSYGIEKKYTPHPEVDLKEFSSKINDLHSNIIQQKVNDIYALFIKYKENNIPYTINHIDNKQLQNLLEKNIETKLTSLFRSPLYFEKPLPIKNAEIKCSIIVISQGNYIYSLNSLLSIYEQKSTSLEVIIVSNGAKFEQDILSHCFKNIKLIFSPYHISLEKLAEKALKEASSDNILFLYGGCTLLPGTLKALLLSIKTYNIHVASPQIINSHGDVKEASALLWRNGHIHSCNQETKPYNNEISSLREVNCFHHSAFFAKKHLLENIWDKVLESGINNEFISIALSLKEKKEKIFYIPEFIIKDLRGTHHNLDIKDDLKDNLNEKIRYYFPDVIAKQAIPNQEHSLITEASSKAHILFICSAIPLYKNSSSERRFLSLIHIFKQMNWQIIIISLEKKDNILNKDLGIILEYPRDVEFLIGEEYLNHLSFYRRINITWIIGTNSFSQIRHIIKDGRNNISSSMIILDTIDLDGKGLRTTEKYLTHIIDNHEGNINLLSSVKKELSDAWMCQAILSLNYQEKTLIEQIGHGIVTILPPYLPAQFKKNISLNKFKQRSGLLFSLPIYEENDGQHDALKWLCLNIIPFLRKNLDDDIPVWIGNKMHGCIDISFYERYSQIELMPSTISYEELLQNCRVLVVPSRKMTLYPLEILEAGEYGLPSVIGEPFCSTLGLKKDEEIISGGENNPEIFANKIALLYNNEEIWTKISHNIYKAVNESYTEEHYKKQIRDFLNSLMEGTERILPKQPVKRLFKPASLRVRFKKEEIKEDKNISFPEEEDITEEDDFIPKTRLGVSLND